MKTALLFHRLGPYHVARLEAAAQLGATTAIELSAETGEYAWDKIGGAKTFQRVTLFPEGDSRAASPQEVQARVSRALNECHPQIVAIPGWSDPGALAALDWCLRSHVPAVLMSESTAHDERRVWWKEFIKRRMVGLYSTALVGGRAHASYLQRLGMSPERIFTGYDVVDNGHFQKAESKKQKAEISGSPPSTAHRPPSIDPPYFLASARFIEKKNLPVLLQAYAEYREKAESGKQKAEVRSQKSETRDTSSADPLISDFRPPTSDLWDLVLLGDGPLRPALKSQILNLNLHDWVHLPGFKQYDELPEYYAGASAFIHASTSEQWGLVVNEALAAGLPVLVSNRCGCVPELVREGVNGFTFDPRSRSDLADLMATMAARPADELARFGRASREIIAQFSPTRFAEGLLQAAGLAHALPRRRAGVFDRLLLQRLIRRGKS